MGDNKFGYAALCIVLILGAFGAGAVVMTATTGSVDWFFDLNPFGGEVIDDDDGEIVDIEGETSQFVGTLLKADSTTKITEEPIYIWYDWNGDGVMQRGDFGGYTTDEGLLGDGEIEDTSSAATTGIFTSPSEYPIDEVIYLFIDDEGEEYQMTYKKVAMSGSRNSDGSAKTIGEVEVRATDDGSLDYSGLINGKAIDDGTDYNATTDGDVGEFELRIKLATSDAGFSSQTGYGVNPTYDTQQEYWTHWGSGVKYAPSFIGFYLTNQDADDMGLKSSQFDFVKIGTTNTFYATYLWHFDESDTGDMFYDSDDTVAPTFKATWDVDCDAAGAMIYIGLFQDVLWDDFVDGDWGPTTDGTILGTLGADWDFVI